MSIYPTLCELTGIPTPGHVEGTSIVPLLKNPKAKWSRPAITTHGQGNHAIRSETHRYIRYANGDEELYHNKKDPYEYTNLAHHPEYASVKQQMAKWLPKNEAAEKKKK